MAKVTGPLMSMSAKGSIGQAITFATWKGINVVKKWFTPANPKTDPQTSVRESMRLSVLKWQELPGAQSDAYDAGASGTGKSGFNLCTGRMIDAWIDQFSTADQPLSVTNVGNYPDDVITWTKVT